MPNFLIPVLFGFSVAILVVWVIKKLRHRSEKSRPQVLEEPQSRQHRRALERRMNKDNN